MNLTDGKDREIDVPRVWAKVSGVPVRRQKQ